MFYNRNNGSRNFTATTNPQELFAAATKVQELIPNVVLPSTESPLVLPGEPNPFNKPGLIPIFQYISNIYQQYINAKVNVGYLQVNVTTASGTIPVPNAKITISKPLGNNIFMSQIVFTNEDGKTPLTPLPTRSPELSQTDQYPVPYTIWNLTAEAPGYNQIVVYDVPIFPGVTTNQSFDLVPTKENHVGPSEEIFASSVKRDSYY